MDILSQVMYIKYKEKKKKKGGSILTSLSLCNIKKKVVMILDIY
jgi:hypothetical protein